MTNIRIWTVLRNNRSLSDRSRYEATIWTTIILTMKRRIKSLRVRICGIIAEPLLSVVRFLCLCQADGKSVLRHGNCRNSLRLLRFSNDDDLYRRYTIHRSNWFSRYTSQHISYSILRQRLPGLFSPYSEKHPILSSSTVQSVPGLCGPCIAAQRIHALLSIYQSQ